MRSASRAAEIRSSNGIVGITPPASSRDRAGWVMSARAASSVWDRPSARRRSRTAWPIRNALGKQADQEVHPAEVAVRQCG